MTSAYSPPSSVTFGEIGNDAAHYTAASLLRLQGEEARAWQQDQAAETTARLRNDLESMLFSVREDAAGKLVEFITPADRDELVELVRRTEEWYWSDDGYNATSGQYQMHISAIGAMADPILKRLYEFEYRESSFVAYVTAVDRVNRLVTSKVPPRPSTSCLSMPSCTTRSRPVVPCRRPLSWTSTTACTWAPCARRLGNGFPRSAQQWQCIPST